MQQASCLEGGPLLWIWPLYLHVNQKSDDDDDDDDNFQPSGVSISCFLKIFSFGFVSSFFYFFERNAGDENISVKPK